MHCSIERRLIRNKMWGVILILFHTFEIHRWQTIPGQRKLHSLPISGKSSFFEERKKLEGLSNPPRDWRHRNRKIGRGPKLDLNRGMRECDGVIFFEVARVIDRCGTSKYFLLLGGRCEKSPSSFYTLLWMMTAIKARLSQTETAFKENPNVSIEPFREGDWTQNKLRLIKQVRI